MSEFYRGMDPETPLLARIVTGLFTGGLAAAIGKTVVAPLERVRLMRQTESLIHGQTKFRGSADILQHIYQNQGFYSLWRGNTANVLRIIPTYTLRFMFLDFFQLSFQSSETSPSLPLQMSCAGLSGFATVLVTYPLDLARTRMSVDVLTKSSVVKTLRVVLEQHGLKGLYRGLFVSILEITPYLAISLGGFEYFKRKIPEEYRSPSTKLLIGWITGVSASVMCFPIDTVKRRIMLDPSYGLNQETCVDRLPSTSMRIVWSYAEHMYARGGVRIFYRGCLINALNAAPSAAITFVANDYLKEFVANIR